MIMSYSKTTDTTLKKMSDKWLLRFHPDKCQVSIDSKLSTLTANYSLCNTKLQSTTTEKSIGVVVDDQVTFEDHINENNNLYLYNHACKWGFRTVNKKSKTEVFESLIVKYSLSLILAYFKYQ